MYTPYAILFLAVVPIQLLFVFMVWTFLPAPGPRATDSLLPVSNFTRVYIASVLPLIALYLAAKGLATLGGCQSRLDAATLTFTADCTDLPGMLPIQAEEVRRWTMPLVAMLPFSAPVPLVTEFRARWRASPLPPDPPKG